ncbi:MAG: hypothetical protein Q8P67_21290 [archaeon]|nr:hypothetical protein [archaeon]
MFSPRSQARSQQDDEAYAFEQGFMQQGATRYTPTSRIRRAVPTFRENVFADEPTQPPPPPQPYQQPPYQQPQQPQQPQQQPFKTTPIANRLGTFQPTTPSPMDVELFRDPLKDPQWQWVLSLLRWRLLAAAFWTVVATWATLLCVCYVTFTLFPLHSYFRSFLLLSSYLPTLCVYLATLGALYLRSRHLLGDASQPCSLASSLLTVAGHALLGVLSFLSLLAITRNTSFLNSARLLSLSQPPETAPGSISEALLKHALFGAYLGLCAASKVLFWDSRSRYIFPLVCQTRWDRFRGRIRASLSSAFSLLLVIFGSFQTLYFYFGFAFSSIALGFLSLFSEAPLALAEDVDHSTLSYLNVMQASLAVLLLWEFTHHLAEIIFTDPIRFDLSQTPPLRAHHGPAPQTSSETSDFPAEYLPCAHATLRSLLGAPHLINALQAPSSPLVRHHAALDFHRLAHHERPRRSALIFGESRVDLWMTLLYLFTERVCSLSKELGVAVDAAETSKRLHQNLPPKPERFKLWLKQLFRRTFGAIQPIPLNATTPSSSNSSNSKSTEPSQAPATVAFPWTFGRGLRTFLQERSRERSLLGDWQALILQIEALTRILLFSREEDSFGVIQNTNSLILILNTFATLRLSLEAYLTSIPAPVITSDQRLYTHQYLRLRPFALIEALNRSLSIITKHFQPYYLQIQGLLSPQTVQLIETSFLPHPFS